MNIRQLIKTLCAYKEISTAQLAKMTDQTPQNLGNKLARNDMKIGDLEKITGALDCKIELSVIDKEKDQIVYKS